MTDGREPNGIDAVIRDADMWGQPAGDGLFGDGPVTEAHDHIAVSLPVLSALRAATTADELRRATAGADAFVAALAAATPSSPGRDRTHRRIGRRSAALGIITILVTAGSAAAATGNLPGPAQRGVSQALSYVGVDLPSGRSDAATDEADVSRPPGGAGAPTPARSTASTPIGPAATDEVDRIDPPATSATPSPTSTSAPVGDALPGSCAASARAGAAATPAQVTATTAPPTEGHCTGASDRTGASDAVGDPHGDASTTAATPPSNPPSNPPSTPAAGDEPSTGPPDQPGSAPTTTVAAASPTEGADHAPNGNGAAKGAAKNGGGDPPAASNGNAKGHDKDK